MWDARQSPVGNPRQHPGRKLGSQYCPTTFWKTRGVAKSFRTQDPQMFPCRLQTLQCHKRTTVPGTKHNESTFTGWNRETQSKCTDGTNKKLMALPARSFLGVEAIVTANTSRSAGSPINERSCQVLAFVFHRPHAPSTDPCGN